MSASVEIAYKPEAVEAAKGRFDAMRERSRFRLVQRQIIEAAKTRSAGCPLCGQLVALIPGTQGDRFALHRLSDGANCKHSGAWS